MKTEIQNIISLLSRTFEKNAWHGPSVKEVLNDITAEQSFTKLRDTHSIIELVAHMTAWRIFVIKKLEGDENYKVEDEKNFPSETDWMKTLNDLSASQLHLLELLKDFPATKLSDVVHAPPYKYSFYTLLHGIIHHDLYHIGQIALIKKTFI